MAEKGITNSFAFSLESTGSEANRIDRELSLSRMLIDALSAHICVLDHTGTILLVNKAWRDFALAGNLKDPNFAVGSNYLKVCESAQGPDKDIASRCCEGIRAVITGRNDIFTIEYPCHSPTVERWFIAHFTKFTVDNQSFLAVSHEDITNRKKAEEALIESENLFRQVLSNVRDVIWTTNNDLVYTYISPSVMQLRGYRPDEVVNQRVEDSMTPDSYKRVMDAYEARLEAESQGRMDTVSHLEVQHYRKDGSLVWVEVMEQRIYDSHGVPVGFAGVSRDISARKQAELDRSKLEVQLRQRQKLESIGTLASGVAHEINNPLNSILNYAELIKMDKQTPADQYADRIIAQTERAATIVRNLLTFARLGREDRAKASVSKIILDTISLFETAMRHDNIKLNVDIQDDLPEIECIEQQIQQVIINLLTNARDAVNSKYTANSDAKKIDVSADLHRQHDSEIIRISVEDNGTGISSENLDRLFDPFFTTKPREIGTGLGLSISHGIITDHKGTIRCESEPGEYTRFVIDLPVSGG